MMFEMKYDKNGLPLKNQQPEEAPQEPTTEPDEEQQPDEGEVAFAHTDEAKTEEVSEEKPQKKFQAFSSKENLSYLRQKAEKLAAERDALHKELQQYKSHTAPQEVKEPSKKDEPVAIGDDELVEGKHLSKVSDKIRRLEEQVKQYEQKNNEFTVESRLKSNYPDYFQIVSQENVAKLREYDPDIADAIYHTPDLYKKAALTYKMIKQYGIVQEDKFLKEKRIAKENAAKPKSLNSISPQTGNNPLSRANAFADGLTPELKTQLLKEMNQARKGI